MSLSIGVDSAWKTVAGVWIGVGGAWKQVTSLIAAYLPATLNEGTGKTGGGQSIAAFQLNLNGGAYTSNATGTGYEGARNFTWNSDGGSAGNYSAKFHVVTSTTAPSGTFDSWLALSTSREVTIGSGTGSPDSSNDCEITVEIAETANTGNILATMTLTLVANWNDGS